MTGALLCVAVVAYLTGKSAGRSAVAREQEAADAQLEEAAKRARRISGLRRVAAGTGPEATLARDALRRMGVA